MNIDDLKQMVEGLTEPTKNIIIRDLKADFTKSIQAVNALKPDREKISPAPSKVLNAFKLCPIETARVVLIAQDPYPNPLDAQGLAFSISRDRKFPPSLNAIYDCMHRQGLLQTIPTHGDLTAWAAQGVLLINCALTTAVQPNAHAKCWEDYTSKIIEKLSAGPNRLVFILLGGFAQQKAKSVDKTRHDILVWGHPSSQNPANRTDNPKHFKYCDAFIKCNQALMARGSRPICWNPDCIVDDLGPINVTPEFKTTAPNLSPESKTTAKPNIIPLDSTVRESGGDDPTPSTSDILWIFTDGGSTANGKANCVASWAYYITDGCYCTADRGLVDLIDIPSEVYKTSNQRGELTAIYNALLRVQATEEFSYSTIQIVSDSEYSIKCLTVWVEKWKHEAKSQKHSNMDLISPARVLLDNLESFGAVKFQHIDSHRVEPTDRESEEWFLWSGNHLVDKHCDAALGVTVKKPVKGRPVRAKKQSGTLRGSSHGSS